MSIRTPRLVLTSLVALAGSVAALPSASAKPSFDAPALLDAKLDAEATRLLSPLPPPCTGDTCTGDVEPQAKGMRTVYLNFDGVTLKAVDNQLDDARANTAWMITAVVQAGQSLTIPPFNANDLGNAQGATRQEIINYTVAKLEEYHQPYNVEFTTTRPSSGNYHMVVFGGTCPGVVGENCAGIAPLDCADLNPNNIVFAFPKNLRAVDLASTAAQELAHALGLSHTLDNSDIMFPQIQNSLPTGYGAGPIPAEDQGPCGNGSYQDSHELLASIIGFRGEDSGAPSVLISSHQSQDILYVGDRVSADISDESGIKSAALLLNNEAAGNDSSAPFEFTIPANAPLGEVTLKVTATDNQDNEGSHKITVYIASGNEETCAEGGSCPSGQSCVQDLCFGNANTTGALGEQCVDNEDCDSNQCAEFREELRCSQSCTTDSECPSGFECAGDVACWPKESESGGCATGSNSSGVLGAFGFLLLALAFRRRAH